MAEGIRDRRKGNDRMDRGTYSGGKLSYFRERDIENLFSLPKRLISSCFLGPLLSPSLLYLSLPAIVEFIPSFFLSLAG